MRRWKGKGGRRRWGPGVLFSGAVPSGQVAGPVAGGAETDLSDAQLCVPSGSETDLSDVERYAIRSFVVLRLRRRLILAVRSICLVHGPSRYDPFCGCFSGHVANVQLASSCGQLLDMVEMLVVWAACGAGCSTTLAGAGRHDVLDGLQLVVQLALDGVRERAGARGERAEAGSVSFEHDSDAFLTCQC